MPGADSKAVRHHLVAKSKGLETCLDVSDRDPENVFFVRYRLPGEKRHSRIPCSLSAGMDKIFDAIPDLGGDVELRLPHSSHVRLRSNEHYGAKPITWFGRVGKFEDVHADALKSVQADKTGERAMEHAVRLALAQGQRTGYPVIIVDMSFPVEDKNHLKNFIQQFQPEVTWDAKGAIIVLSDEIYGDKPTPGDVRWYAGNALVEKGERIYNKAPGVPIEFPPDLRWREHDGHEITKCYSQKELEWFVVTWRMSHRDGSTVAEEALADDTGRASAAVWYCSFGGECRKLHPPANIEKRKRTDTADKAAYDVATTGEISAKRAAGAARDKTELGNSAFLVGAGT